MRRAVLRGLKPLVAVLAAALLVACGGSSETPGSLTQRLEQVDRAVVSGERPAVQRAVRSLLQEVDRAEASGSLDAAQASRIREAAEAVLAAVPGADRSPEPAQTPGQDPPAGDLGEDDKGPGKDEDRGKEKDHPHDKGPGKDKGRGDEDEGHGDDEDDD